MVADIQNLLDLHDQIFAQDRDCWVKIRVWRVSPSADIPHGIRYALTLHDKAGTRLLGYDNAHAPKRPKGFKYAGQKLPYDHKHRTATDEGVVYNFQSAEQLLVDFWTDVDAVLNERFGK